MAGNYWRLAKTATCIYSTANHRFTTQAASELAKSRIAPCKSGQYLQMLGALLDISAVLHSLLYPSADSDILETLETSFIKSFGLYKADISNMVLPVELQCQVECQHIWILAGLRFYSFACLE